MSSSYVSNDPSSIKITNLYIRVNNNKIVTLSNLTGATKISELKRLYKDKEKAHETEEIIFICGSKQITEKDDNKILADFGMKNNTTLGTVFRVLGGAEGYFEDSPPGVIESGDGPRRISKNEKNWPKNVKPSTKDCSVLLSPPEEGCYHAQMPCHENHVISPEGMYQYLNSGVILNGDGIIKCMNSGCSAEWNAPDCFWVAKLSEDEESTISKKLTENFLKSNPLFRECPFCKGYVHRKGMEENRVRCPLCLSKDWCWFCLKPWIGSDSYKCGNEDCNMKAQYIKIINNCDRKTISNISNVPVARLCPKCETLIEWKGNCKHVVCVSCHYDFCLSCLKGWKELNKGKYSNHHISEITPDTCPVHPIQKEKLFFLD